LTGRGSNLALIAASCLVALLLLETAGRVLVKPYEGWYGALFGVPLPPMQLVLPPRDPVEARDTWYAGLTVDGQRITVGDVAGYYRYDALLGYAPLEDAISVSGWWRSNEIGARESGPTSPGVAPGQRRWILLGESFAHGSGLPGSQGWAEIADVSDPGVDIVNLGVDGYSVAQAYLRYSLFANRLEHQGVMLMFVPGVDLWRDINVVRELGEPWKVRGVMPRFVLEGDGLRLVQGPYAGAGEFDRDNRDGLSDRLRVHLRRYDRFYFPFEHDPVPLVGHLLSFKIMAAAYGRYARGRIRRAQFRPGSEALEVSRRIFLMLEEETTARSRDFMLLVLPTATDLQRLHSDATFAGAWQDLVDSSCSGLRYCVDLAPVLAGIPSNEIDLGPDGNHFGPRTNDRIARAVLGALPK